MNPWPDGFLAPLLAAGLFLFWGAIGYAALSGLKTGFERGRLLLIAPIFGAAVCVMLTFWVNWWGVPVGRFAWPLFAGLTAAALAMVWIRRPDASCSDVWYAALPLVAALVLNGWPLFTYGFAWLSYVNDDMATYCLMAVRLMEHGLVEPPSAAVLRASSDLSANMWLFEVTMSRPGTQLLLAWVASLVPRSVVELYMPVLVAMHLALVAAAGGLVWRAATDWRAALVTCWLLAASALTALGTVTQLFAQVFGLALACGFLVLVWDIDRPPLGMGRALAAAVTGAALFIVYTEFVPFVAIPVLARLLASGLWRRDRRRPLQLVGAIAAGGLLLVAPYADRFTSYLVQSARYGVRSSANGSDLFPYFRLATAFANLWGLLPIARPVSEPLLSAAIVAGALGFAALFVVLVPPLRRGHPAPATLLFMLSFGLLLMVRGSGFGLFKLAMYGQPFMLGTAALVLVPASGHARSRARWLIIVLIAALGLPTQAYYLRSSVNPAFARTEIQDQRGAMSDLRQLRGFHGRSLDVDLPITATANVAALFVRGVPLRFVGLPESFRPWRDLSLVPKRFLPVASDLSNVVRIVTGMPRDFSLRDPGQPSKSDRFNLAERPSPDGRGPVACEAVLTSAASQSIINRTTTGAGLGTFRLLSCPEVANHLAFVSSKLGSSYYLPDTDADLIGLFALERDYFFPERTFAGVGRYLLFEVLHPDPKSRLVLDFTSSLKGDGANVLPPVAVVGAERVPLGPVGRGSARLYSKPLAPQWIDGHAYLALDFGADGTLFPESRQGPMAWLGKDVVLDSRRPVGFARNISLVSEAEYERLVPPAEIARFPQDLAAPGLEYSGLYEDGWVSDDLVVALRRPDGPGTFTVKGMLLPTPSGSGATVTIDLDGVAVASERHDPGPFAIEVPVPAGEGGRMAVRLRFSAVRPLSDADRRPASARIEYLGVAPLPASK